MSKLIYAADDEKNIRELLEIFLTDAGYEVEMFENGDTLFNRFSERPCDLVILDIMMPGSDGLEICKRLRENSDVPIIILTAKDTENDYILGMSIGSDDYIMKPFRPTMLLMKIKAILRRIDFENKARRERKERKEQKEHEEDKNCKDDKNYKATHTNKETDAKDKGKNNTSYALGKLEISSYERKIYNVNNGQSLNFSMTEFELLFYMAKYPKKAVSREELLEKVWGIDSDIETRVIDETIRRIRRKLNAVDSGVRIETVWGHGYRIVEVV